MKEKTLTAESLVGHVVERFTDQLNAGEQPRIEDYVAQYPDIAVELRHVLPAVEMMCHIADGSHPLSDDSLDESSETGQPSGCLGDFRILREVGRGGMGVVYEAEQISLNRRVALKVLPFAAVLDPRHLQRFKNEALAAAQLEHPHIVPVYGVGCERGVHHYAMRFIEGQTLAEAIAQLRDERESPRRASSRLSQSAGTPSDPLAPTILSDTPTPPPAPSPERRHLKPDTTPLAALSTERGPSGREWFRTIARMGRDLAGALDYAHENGIIHRDIKPGNIMLDGRGKVWITDFGLARIESDATLTMSGDLLGTLRYMSPEQALAKRIGIDHRTDIYSLGVTLYELLTLQPAYPETDRQRLLHQIANGNPISPRQLNSQIPTDLETIVLKAIAKDAGDRYETARALADDLQRFRQDQPIVARRPTLGRCVVKWSQRHTAVVWSALAFLLLSTVVLGVSFVLVSRAHSRSVEATTELERALDEKDDAIEEKSRALDREIATNQRVYPMNIASAHEHIIDSFESARDLLSLHVPAAGMVDRRGFEWGYLWGLAHPPGLELRGHTETVFSVDFSPDGQLVATASGDRTARLWRTDTGKHVRTLAGHTSDVNQVLFISSGESVLTSSDDKTIGIWNTATGKRLATLKAHEDMVSAMAVSFDERYLYSADAAGTLIVWDLESLEVVATNQAHPHRVNSVALSSDGAYLATCDRFEAKIWRPPLLDPVATFRPQETGAVQSAVFRPGSSIVAVISRDGAIRQWNVDSKQLIDERWTGQYLLSLAFSPNGQQHVVGAGGGPRPRMILGDAEFRSQAIYHFCDRLTQGWCATFSDDDRFLAAGRGHLAVIIPRTQPPNELRLVGLPHGVDCVTVSPDNQRILAGARDGAVRAYDRISGEELMSRIAHPEGVTDLRFSPSGEWLATCGQDQTVRIWETDRDQLAHVINQELVRPVHNVVFSPQGDLLAVQDQVALSVWRTESWGLVDRVAHQPAEIAFALDGCLASSGESPQVWLDPANLQSHFGFSLARHTAHAMDVSPNGELVVFGFRDTHLMMCDISASYNGFIFGRHANPLLAIAFSADGRTLATADSHGTLRLWNVATRTAMMSIGLREPILENGGQVQAFETLDLEFARDNSMLVAGGTYKQVADDPHPRGLIAAWQVR